MSENRKNSLDEFLRVLYNESILNWEEMSITVTDPVHQARWSEGTHSGENLV
jgi:hypothetical protein